MKTTREQAINDLYGSNFSKEQLDTIVKAFEPTTKNDLGVDCISRQALLDATVKKSSIWNHITNSEGDNLEAIVSKLPPVTPQPRKGHWIIDTHKIRAFGKKNETHDYSVHCDKCNYAWDYTTDEEGSLVSNFCPNCGADMREVEDDKKTEEAEAHPINENIAKGFEEFTKMMFKQGQAESEEINGTR